MRCVILEADNHIDLLKIPCYVFSPVAFFIVVENNRHFLEFITCHAEINALRKANKKDKSWRCVNATMYVTVEPCSMCAGALVWSRIDRIVFGAYDKKAGACGSVLNITNNERLNHQIEVTPGVLEDECAKIIKDYFKAKREKK